MKITKLVHSCLIIEQNGKKFLVDPGNYSWQSGAITDEHLTNLDTVVVTHAHPDHLDADFAEAIKKNSPQAHWYGPQQVVSQLAEWGIEAKSTSNDPTIQFINSDHADLSPWFSEQPEHTSYVLHNELLVGGDCHTLTDMHGARVLAAAINGGPWGSVVGFAKMIESMKSRPKTIIPLHDWHWNDNARKAFYARLPEVLSQFDVKFVGLDNGIETEIS
jgi:L-ascorbate metabolism protein UlaG (beta-lactamase superfamily)